MVDPDLAMIFGFIIVITMILGVSVNALISKVHVQQRWERENESGSERAPSGSSEVADRIEMIEDRLHVLERLATDRGQLLAEQIEALREDRAATARIGEVEK